MCFLTVPPEVSVTATQTRIAEGQSTTLTCSIITSNPSDPNITWSFTNTSGVTTIVSGETGQKLQLSDTAEDEFGTYTCNATNSANLSGTGDITIEQGCKTTPTDAIIIILITCNTHSICSHTWGDHCHNWPCCSWRQCHSELFCYWWHSTDLPVDHGGQWHHYQHKHQHRDTHFDQLHGGPVWSIHLQCI